MFRFFFLYHTGEFAQYITHCITEFAKLYKTLLDQSSTHMVRLRVLSRKDCGSSSTSSDQTPNYSLECRPTKTVVIGRPVVWRSGGPSSCATTPTPSFLFKGVGEKAEKTLTCIGRPMRRTPLDEACPKQQKDRKVELADESGEYQNTTPLWRSDLY